MTRLKSAGAVVAGFATTTALVLGADRLIQALDPGAFPHPATGQNPTAGWLTLILAYSFSFGVAGAWLTGRLAPRRPVAHAMILGAIAAALGVAATAATWGQAPAWYQLLLPILPLLAAPLGGRLAARRRV